MPSDFVAIDVTIAGGRGRTWQVGSTYSGTITVNGNFAPTNVRLSSHQMSLVTAGAFSWTILADFQGDLPVYAYDAANNRVEIDLITIIDSPADNPQGSISLPLTNLKELVASSETFQDWTGSGDASAALDRVHLVCEPAPEAGGKYEADELAAMRPFAIVDIFDPPGSYGFQPWFRAKNAEPNGYVDFGKCSLVFEDNVAAGASVAEAKIAFMNKVGVVIDEMAELAGTDAYVVVRSFEVFTPFVRSDQTAEAAQGDFYRVKMVIHWGLMPRGIES